MSISYFVKIFSRNWNGDKLDLDEETIDLSSLGCDSQTEYRFFLDILGTLSIIFEDDCEYLEEFFRRTEIASSIKLGFSKTKSEISTRASSFWN